MIRKRRGISPVIAIVILIAVAVALGIAVAFWATGLIGTLGKVEKLEIRTAYAVTNSSISGWTVYMKGANTGTADITIVEITINGKPFSQYSSTSIKAAINGVSYSSGFSVSITSGSDFSAFIDIPSANFTSGQTIEIALISGSGTAFKRTVVLP